MINYDWYLIASISIIVLASIFDKKQMDIDFGGVAKFLAFLSILTVFRICTYKPSPIAPDTYNIQFYDLLFVFLEDAFFVMIPYYITKVIKNKFAIFLIWLIASAIFGSYHLYQGVFTAVLISFYPYFISRKYAIRTSFATVMACHVLYDVCTLLTLKLLPILPL
jgi:hypothetical protein